MTIQRFLIVLMKWLAAFALAAGIVMLIRLFCIESYRISTDSMEEALHKGDYILVNKIPGKNKPVRGKVVLFTSPLSRDSADAPLFISRCIGIPGDSLQIKGGFYEINGRRGIGNLNDQEMLSNYRGEYPQGIYNTYPFDYRLGWNFINFGPLYLPRKGDTLPIDTSAVRIYYKMIKYESGLNLQEREGQVWCGDSLVERYTFRTNWYFMGGDNMWNSQDSRYLGPIPEEFIIGKATLILTAKDPETKAYRWRRFFTRIRKEVKNR